VLQKEVKIPIEDQRAQDLAMKLDRKRDEAHYGYSTQMATKPQTLGYGLADSPVAQAAWIYEKLHDWSSHPMPFSKDEILDTIMLYWLSNSATSSARYYYECGLHATMAVPIGKEVSVGVSWFPGDTSYAAREWCGRYWGNVVSWKEVERGGHFAAWEVPGLFLREVREWRGVVEGRG
jgi:pimeloyl-ACP methyl ester carboxylesterase